MTAPYKTKDFTASSAPGHVIIIGGGIGGLCLAQGLKRAGVSCAVYERERSITDRLQGYRVHISPGGSTALHECLPPHLFEAFERTCGVTAGGARMLTEQMKVLMSFGQELRSDEDDVAKHRSVSRITLRQVLLAELDNVHFGKAFTRYEERGGRLVAHFEDGTVAEGDMLVAADGSGSRVRRQFLPQAERVDTGVVGIAGKVFLDEAGDRLHPYLLEGINLVAARGLGLFAAVQKLSGESVGGIGRNDPAAQGALFDNERSYVTWGLSARVERLGLAEPTEALDSATLRDAAARAMAGWAPELRLLPNLADPDTISLLRIRTSTPVAPWPSGRVTLLGDAIHAMTPYRGIGANVALRDAMRLARALAAARRGERELIAAVHDYEAGMLDYGFRAVRNSLTAMHQTLDQGPLGLAASRLMFRLIDRLPPLKRRMAASMGRE